jgi:hypothetical protein
MNYRLAYFSLPSIMAIMLLGLTGCSTMTSHADWDTSANFRTLKTYAWAPGQQPRTGDPRIDNNSFLDQRVRQAVDNTLTTRGYLKTNSNPDFWVSYQAAIEEKLSATTMPAYGYLTPYGSDLYDYSAWSEDATMITQYDEGSLIIDVADAKTKKLIWRGTVSDVVDPAKSPEKRQQKINKAVAQAFENFPPQ